MSGAISQRIRIRKRSSFLEEFQRHWPTNLDQPHQRITQSKINQLSGQPCHHSSDETELVFSNIYPRLTGNSGCRTLVPGPAIEWRREAVRWWDLWLGGRDSGKGGFRRDPSAWREGDRAVFVVRRIYYSMVDHRIIVCAQPGTKESRAGGRQGRGWDRDSARYRRLAVLDGQAEVSKNRCSFVTGPMAAAVTQE
jgi:hypothetical protein